MSFEKVLEMRAERAGLITEARAILDAAEAEKREMTAEEQQKYNKIIEDARKLKEKAEREERQIALENEVRGMEQKPGASTQQETPEERMKKAFHSYLVTGAVSEELRSLVSDVNPQGGYLHAPEQYVAELLKGINNAVFVMQYARKLQVTMANSLGVPTLESDLTDAAWTGEVALIPEDTNMSFGKRELKPEQLSKLVKVSSKLLTTSAIPVESLIAERMAYKFAVSLENGFLNGSGSSQPLGVFTASDKGIPTSRDIKEGNTATAVTADGLVSAKYALKQQYRTRNSVRWLFHRDTWLRT